MKLVDYKLEFPWCSLQALDCEITATCVVSMGKCHRDHDNKCSVRNSDKVGFRSAINFFHS